MLPPAVLSPAASRAQFPPVSDRKDKVKYQESKINRKNSFPGKNFGLGFNFCNFNASYRQTLEATRDIPAEELGATQSRHPTRGPKGIPAAALLARRLVVHEMPKTWVQETCIRAYDKIGTFRAELGNCVVSTASPRTPH